MMNAAHFHLIVTHFPIAGIVIGFLLLVFSLFKKSRELQMTSLVLFVGVAILTIPLYLSGEGAEELVEDAPGVSKQMIEEHEEAGEYALIAAEVLGVASLAAVTVMALRGASFGLLGKLCLALSIFTMVVIGRT